MQYPNCHSENNEHLRFCTNCAAPLNVADTAQASLTQILATALQVVSKDDLIADKCRLFEEIGQGRMGIVYNAEDIKLKWCIALKFLLPHLMNSPERDFRKGRAGGGEGGGPGRPSHSKTKK